MSTYIVEDDVNKVLKVLSRQILRDQHRVNHLNWHPLGDVDLEESERKMLMTRVTRLRRLREEYEDIMSGVGL